jgi:hypothetical protein
MDLDDSGWDTHLALHTASLIQQSIRHADTKIATMSGVVCGSALFVSGQIPGIGRLAHAGLPWFCAGLALAAITLTGLAGALWHLGDGLRPRLGRADTAGELGLTALAGGLGRPCPGGGPVEADQCWRLARTLAQIALTKHERVRGSLVWTAIALTGITGIVLCTNLPSGMAHHAWA